MARWSNEATKQQIILLLALEARYDEAYEYISESIHFQRAIKHQKRLEMNRSCFNSFLSNRNNNWCNLTLLLCLF